METRVARLSDLVRGQSPDPSANAVTSKPLPAEPDASESCRRWFAAAKEELIRLRDAVRLGDSLRLDCCEALAADLVQELRQGEESVRWALRGLTDDYVLDNALHVAVISVKIGMGLRYETEGLDQLALSGLLHDVGMWTLSDAVLQHPGALTEEQLVAVRAHPERGRRLIMNCGSSYERLASVVAQEHERCDGTGYPCRLKGSQISEPAQIIALADTFDALVTARPYRKHIPPHHALRELLVHGKAAFAHRALKALGDQVTLYPVGTPVRLNTGERGTVSRVNPRYPLRPTLVVQRGGLSGGLEADGEVDLVQRTSVHIVEVLQSASAG